MTRDLDALYQEYESLCRDRGAFPKARGELHHYDEGKWLTYVLALISDLPSQAERQVAIQKTPDEPFRKHGDI